MSKKGQALIEFILIMPVMVYLILVFVDFSLILSTKNKLDNNVSNLEWCTVAHNTQHSYNHGYQRGKSGNCKLSDAQVILIRRLRLAGLSRFEVCALFPEIKQSTIFDCYYYETYKHIQREDILYDEFSC